MNAPAPGIAGGAHSPPAHDGGARHVTGKADYIDDMPEPAGCPHACHGLSSRAHARIGAMDRAAVIAAPGIIGVPTAEDIPGHNDVSPTVRDDDPVFSTGTTQFHGQPLFSVIATTRYAARRAAPLAEIEYADLSYFIDVADALAAEGPMVTEPLKLERGDVRAGMARDTRRVEERMRIGGQDHFHLEGQIALAIPGEDGAVTVFSSTKHPSEVQHMAGHVLGLNSSAVTVNVRRMGRGFGGKKTRPNVFAAVAALGARKFGRAMNIRPDRDDDIQGFGGSQGIPAGERIVENIAYTLGRGPLYIRRANFFFRPGRDVMPYHQIFEDNVIGRIVDELKASSDHHVHRAALLDFKRSSPVIRRGIALTPRKFGNSFTVTWCNQAGAMVRVYQDGSVQLNHGGAEMGQGLPTKVAQVVADAFEIDIDRIRVTATTTDKVTNTSATTASPGGDLNGMAAADAARQIKDGLVAFAAEIFETRPENVRFAANHVIVKDREIPFADLVKSACVGRIRLSAAGSYKTPEIHWDRASGKGRSFYYFARGAAVSEVSLDTLTGGYKVDRTDILCDVCRSLNPAIDVGQIEGGFIPGMGRITAEEIWRDDDGRLLTHAPSTYRIPLASDRPQVFNVRLAEWSENVDRTVKRSTAVGEPPLMLAMSVLEALSMAAAPVADCRVPPRIDLPATPERMLMAVERLRAEAAT